MKSIFKHLLSTLGMEMIFKNTGMVQRNLGCKCLFTLTALGNGRLAQRSVYRFGCMLPANTLISSDLNEVHLGPKMRKFLRGGEISTERDGNPP